MKMSEEMAVRLHRMMWSDMQKELGDNPSGKERAQFKFDWIHKHFPSESIANDCWLCEYASSVANQKVGDLYCIHCPIKWPNRHCNTMDFSYTKNPISEILAVPAKSDKIMDEKAVVTSYYKFREDLLSKASGIPATSPIEDHVKAIQEKAVAEKAVDVIDDFLYRCEKYPDTPINEQLKKRLCAIKEKAIEEYFEKTPGAKLATMDVDQAFKQYADEQKAPIFHALAEASGLSAGNKSVSAHISLIRDTAKQDGRMERSREIFNEMSKTSGLNRGNWCLNDHIKAIQARASNEKDMDMELLRKTSMQLADKLNGYKDALSEESGLNRDRPIDEHIREIVKSSMEAGADEERDRIQEKIYEVLLS